MVLVPLENRSFDDMLGHLKYEDINPDVHGLDKDLGKYTNSYKGGAYIPFQLADRELVSDLSHEWNLVAKQLDWSAVTQRFNMDGFVTAYAEFTGTEPAQNPDPMGFFSSKTVPITSFLAQNFCVCDHCTRLYRPARSRIGRWPFAVRRRFSIPRTVPG